MKKIILGSLITASLLSINAFAAIPDLEANSLIACEEGSTVSDAVAELNGTLASPFYNVKSESTDSYYKINNYVGSAPVITKLDNGRVSVCVTLTRKK
ncbi:MAG: hypothetical protein SFW66_07330 [Gammaproteobacteria bacterium]|nr:hypothetical protein [Gammaproteobacteria bacterium]